eukprot:3937126-Rhodomonas_salina.1
MHWEQGGHQVVCGRREREELKAGDEGLGELVKGGIAQRAHPEHEGEVAVVGLRLPRERLDGRRVHPAIRFHRPLQLRAVPQVQPLPPPVLRVALCLEAAVPVRVLDRVHGPVCDQSSHPIVALLARVLLAGVVAEAEHPGRRVDSRLEPLDACPGVV